MTSILFPEQALEVARVFWTHCGWDLDCNTPSVQDLADYLVGVAIQTPTGCPSCATAEAQNDRLTAALDLEARARQQMAEGLAQASEDLRVLRAAACVKFPVEDPATPGEIHIIRGTLEGIHALQRLLQQSLNDGRVLGRAESSDLIEALQASLSRAV